MCQAAPALETPSLRVALNDGYYNFDEQAFARRALLRGAAANTSTAPADADTPVVRLPFATRHVRLWDQSAAADELSCDDCLAVIAVRWPLISAHACIREFGPHSLVMWKFDCKTPIRRQMQCVDLSEMHDGRAAFMMPVPDTCRSLSMHAGGRLFASRRELGHICNIILQTHCAGPIAGNTCVAAAAAAASVHT